MKGNYIKGTGLAINSPQSRLNGEECEDSLLLRLEQRCGLVVVCDGMGSAKHAAVGARVASNTVFELLWASAERFMRQSLQSVADEIVDAAIVQMQLEAEKAAADIGQLACTLVFVLALPSKSAVRFLAGNLGDGLVVMRRKDNLNVLLEPERGEFANQSFFLTSKSAKERLRLVSGVVPAHQVPGWLICSDGATEQLFDRRSDTIAPAAFGLLEDLRTGKPSEVEDLLRGLIFDSIQPYSNDDCSIGLLQTATRGAKVPRATQ